jgi:hypothetical protein
MWERGNMPKSYQRMNPLVVVCAAHLLLLHSAGVVLAADCGCVNIAAQSYSDSGQCVVDETTTGFCTLDWRHGAESQGSDPEEVARSEAGARNIANLALSGHLAYDSPFANQSLWSQLGSITQGASGQLLYKGAAAYLDQTRPEKYEQELALAGIAALVGSATASRNKSAASVVLTYISQNFREVHSRLIGNASSEPIVRKTRDGMIADHSAYGCFEIRRLVSGSVDPFGPFDFRVGVRTAYAEDSHCLRR